MKSAALLGLVLPIALAGCVGGRPPGAKPELVERPSEIKAWEDELDKSPHDIRLYQRLIDFDFQAGDFVNARRTALQCVDMNPRSWEAWMLAAQVHRTLFELTATETALKKAKELAPEKEATAVIALSGFYSEVGDPEAALREAEAAFAIQESVTTAIALVRSRYAAGNSSFELLEVKGSGDDLFELLLAQYDSEMFDEVYSLSEIAEVAKPKHAREVMRLVHLTAKEPIKAALQGFLNVSEDADIRFACYFGLWQIAICQESLLTIPGHSAEAQRLAEKLDQIDDRHPMWLMRHYQYAQTSGATDELSKIAENLRAIGLAPPTTIEPRDRLFILWAIEDASRLGLPRRARNRMEEINPGDGQMDAYLLQFASLLSQSGQNERALKILKTRLSSEVDPPMDAVRYQAFVMRAMMGEAKEVEAELQAMAKAEAPFRVPVSSLAWLRALVDYHKAR